MTLEIHPVRGIPEIDETVDLGAVIAEASQAGPHGLLDDDVLVVTQKIVSKAEDAMVDIDPSDPLSHKPIVERESVRILRRRGELIISETKHGFVCANAGIDLSNVARGRAALLPDDSDRSARKIRDRIRGLTGITTAVIVSDTFGRPWRRGVTDVAIGCAGIHAIADLRGTNDALGMRLWPRSSKKARKASRISAPVRGRAASVRDDRATAMAGSGSKSGSSSHDRLSAADHVGRQQRGKQQAPEPCRPALALSVLGPAGWTQRRADQSCLRCGASGAIHGLRALLWAARLSSRTG